MTDTFYLVHIHFVFMVIIASVAVHKGRKGSFLLVDDTQYSIGTDAVVVKV